MSADTAHQHDYSIYEDNSLFSIMWGDGKVSNTARKVAMGDYTALIVDKIPETLIGIPSLVDNNLTITFDKDKATITDNNNSNNVLNKTIIPRSSDGLWRMNIKALDNINNKQHKAQDDIDYNNDNNNHNNNNYITSTCGYSARLRELPISLRDKVFDLHERMGHCPCDAMCKAVSGSNPTWKNSPVTEQEIRRVFETQPCLVCILAKHNLDGNKSTTDIEDKRVYYPGECICADPVPKISPMSYDGNISFFAYTDMSTGYLFAIPTNNKETEAFLEGLEIVRMFFHQYDYKVKIIRVDTEINLNSGKVNVYTSANQIEVENSTPYRHHQNGAERYIQTIIKGTCSLLHGQVWLRADGWADALRHYVRLRNRTPNVHTDNQSPWQIITKHQVDLKSTYSFIFGDIVVVGKPKELRTGKFNVRNDIGIYVGQTEGYKDSHRIYSPLNHKVYERGSVHKVDISDIQLLKWYNTQNNKSEAKLPYKDVQDAVYFFFPPDDINNINKDTVRLSIPIIDPNNNKKVISMSDYSKQLMNNKHRKRNGSEIAAAIVDSGSSQDSHNNVNNNKNNDAILNATPSIIYEFNSNDNDGPITRSMRRDMQQSVSAALAKTRNEDTPTVADALTSINRDMWVEAINKEKTLLFEGTLVKIDELPPPNTYYIIYTTTQLKIKRSAATGLPERFKARTCARGDMLLRMTNTMDKYSPTVSALTFATVFQIAIIMKMKRRIVDTVGAYLYQDYMPSNGKKLLVRLEPKVAEVCQLDPTQLYEVKKYLYGLPDAGRAYYIAYSNHLSSNGYTKSRLDPCLFYCINNEEETYIMIHVDDTIVCSTTDAGFIRLENVLKQQFDITVNEDADAYLGIHLETLADNSIRMTQPKLLQSLFSEFPPRHTKKNSSVPMRPSFLSPPHDSSNITTKKYMHLLGILMYLTKSRPDIMSATSFASTKSHAPTEHDYEHLLQIVDYLYHTQDKGLILHSNDSNNDNKYVFQLKCYVDASYLIHPDSKSHTGYTLSFGDTGIFYAKSSKQSLVATSSTHAEMKALYTLVHDILYIIDLCHDIQCPLQLPAIIFEDNLPVMNLATDLATGTRKCKHFLMVIAYIKEQVQQGLVKIIKTPTEENIADTLSKLLPGGKDYQYKNQQLLGQQPNESTILPYQSKL